MSFVQLRAALFSAAITASAIAAACPVCGQAKNAQVERAYIGMTGFMSLTPLAMMAGIVGYVFFRFRQAEKLEQAASQQRTDAAKPARDPNEAGAIGAPSEATR